MEDAAKLVWTKIGAIAILFFITLICGSFPFFCFRSRNDSAHGIRNRVFSILNCFAGGIFLGLCLLDLLPDVTESFEKTLDEDVTYPFAELSVACGLLIVLTIEQTVHGIHEHFSAKTEVEAVGESLPSNSANKRNFGTFSQPPGSSQIHPDNVILVKEEEPTENFSFENRPTDSNPPAHVIETVVDTIQQELDTQVNHVNHHPNQSHDVINATTNGHLDDYHVVHSPSVFRSALLLGALSCHSILEGLAVGILTEPNEVWTFLLAISIHKCVISFSLSINFLSSMKRWTAFLCQVIFALMSPIGIAIGMVIVSQIQEFSSSIWEGILQGAATGTFLYVTFFELLPHEIEGPKDKIWKVLSILVGFGAIAGLITYESSHE